MSFISFHVHDQISVVMVSNIVKDWSCLLTCSSTSSLALIRVPPLWHWFEYLLFGTETSCLRLFARLSSPLVMFDDVASAGLLLFLFLFLSATDVIDRCHDLFLNFWPFFLFFIIMSLILNDVAKESLHYRRVSPPSQSRTSLFLSRNEYLAWLRSPMITLIWEARGLPIFSILLMLRRAFCLCFEPPIRRIRSIVTVGNNPFARYEIRHICQCSYSGGGTSSNTTTFIHLW